MTAPTSPLAYTGVRATNPPTLIQAQRNPNSNDKKYSVGTLWVNTSGLDSFQLVGFSSGSPTWASLGGGTTQIATITGDTGGALSPSGGNINILGTANQITTSGSGSTLTLSLVGPYTPATYTAHGVLIGEGTSSIAATAAGSAGQLLTSGGASADPTWTTATFPATATSTGTILRANGTNWVASTATYPNTTVAGDIIISTAANVVGSLADVATGQVLMSGGVGVAPAYSGSPSVSGSVTAGTSITATAGDITATLGNVVINGAAKQLRVHGGAATDFIGTLTLTNGVSAAIANTNIAATDQIYLVRTAKNGSTAFGSYDYTISANTSFQVTANKADTTTETADQSTLAYFIVRQV